MKDNQVRGFIAFSKAQKQHEIEFMYQLDRLSPNLDLYSFNYFVIEGEKKKTSGVFFQGETPYQTKFELLKGFSRQNNNFTSQNIEHFEATGFSEGLGGLVYPEEGLEISENAGYLGLEIISRRKQNEPVQTYEETIAILDYLSIKEPIGFRELDYGRVRLELILHDSSDIQREIKDKLRANGLICSPFNQVELYDFNRLK